METSIYETSVGTAKKIRKVLKIAFLAFVSLFVQLIIAYASNGQTVH
ncbi:hypothetical protein [Paenibacillus polymyxa]|nr:hypothetical protein [Paenibacillus polymyxa]